MAWTVTGDQGLPLDNGDGWDGGAAENSIFEWAGGTDFDPAKAKRGFNFQDSAAPKLRGSYKDAFAQVTGGTLKARKGGVDACVRRIPDTNGPSQAQKDTAMGHMKSYQSKFGEGGGKSAISESFEESEEVRMAIPAYVRGMNQSPEMTAMAMSRAPDPSIFEDSPPYIWRAEISNQHRDTYDTQMHDSTLRNFAEDARTGVSFQNSHNHRELGFGQSIDGQYHDGRSQGGKRTDATFYTIPDLTLNGVNTNDLIRGMRSGIVRDVSVGFYGGSIRCSECGHESTGMFDHCEHIAVMFGGVYSLANGADGEAAFGWIHDARLSETSCVYDGATPGAMILKAHEELLERLGPTSLRFMANRYRVRLPALAPRRFAGVDTTEEVKEMGDMDERQEAVTAGSVVVGIPEDAIRTVISEAGGDYATLEPVAAIRAMGNDLTRLRPLADDGRAYRSDLIDEAIEEGVRAHGNDFKAETYRAVLEASTIPVIKQMRDDWRTAANAFLKGNGTALGGRQTELRQEGDPPKKRTVPDFAYRV
jgi:hypothetical protein